MTGSSLASPTSLPTSTDSFSGWLHSPLLPIHPPNYCKVSELATGFNSSQISSSLFRKNYLTNHLPALKSGFSAISSNVIFAKFPNHPILTINCTPVFLFGRFPMCVVSKVWSFIKPGGRSARTKNQTLSEAIENHV